MGNYFALQANICDTMKSQKNCYHGFFIVNIYLQIHKNRSMRLSVFITGKYKSDVLSR